MQVFRRAADGSNSQLGATQSSSGFGFVQVLSLVGLAATINSGDFCHVVLEIDDSADSYRVYGVEITYDRIGGAPAFQPDTPPDTLHP